MIEKDVTGTTIRRFQLPPIPLTEGKAVPVSSIVVKVDSYGGFVQASLVNSLGHSMKLQKADP